MVRCGRNEFASAVEIRLLHRHGTQNIVFLCVCVVANRNAMKIVQVERVFVFALFFLVCHTKRCLIIELNLSAALWLKKMRREARVNFLLWALKL